MPGAGKLTCRLTFQKRGTDASGRPLGAWEDQFDRQAEVLYLRSGEGVLQGRLQGRAPAVLTLREDAETRTIRTTWRAVQAQFPAHTFEIKSMAPARERRWIELTCEALAGE